MRRALVLTTTVTAAAALGACGGDGSSAGAERTPQQRAQDGALRFARCMRERGVDIPDPQVGENGMVRIGGADGPGRAGGPAPGDPRFREAEAACRKHLGAGGGERNPQMEAQARDAMVAFARCMRAEGVDVPDPTAEGGLVFRAEPGAGGPNPRSPAFKRAEGECRHHLADLERSVPREEAAP